MAMIWSGIRSEVQKRVGLEGTGEYDDRAVVAMNAAGDLLHSVQWDCIKTVTGDLTITMAATAAGGLPTDVGITDDKSYRISPKLKVIQGTTDSILINPPSAYGRPLKYVWSGATLHFGCPTANSDYTAKFAYWKKFVTPADSATPEIVTHLGDAVFIAAALWIFAKYFEMEEEQPAVSSSAMAELLTQARLAQARNTFQGPSLEEIIRARA